MSGDSSVSGDGRFVLLARSVQSPSSAVPVRHYYRFDTVLTNATLLTRKFFDETAGTGPATALTISADGRTVAFSSLAPDLVTNDFNLQTDVFVARFEIPDADSNRIDDGWEQLFGQTPDAMTDSDGDGLANRQEYLTGTNPRNAGSVLRIDLSRRGDRLDLVCRTVRGKHYQLESAAAGMPLQWSPLGGAFLAIQAETLLTVQPETGASRFYRLSILPD